MSGKEKKRTKGKKIRNTILAVMTLFSISSFYLIYNILLLSGIEDIIRYGFVAFLVILWAGFIVAAIKTMKSRKIKSFLFFILLSLIIGTVFFAASYYINKAYTSISKMNKSEATYGTSLVTLSNSQIDTVADLKNKKIGIITDTSSVEGYVISQEMINENKMNKDNLVEYDDFLSMLNDLYDENIDAVFLSSGYVSMFSSIDGFSNIKSKTKVIISKTKTMKKVDNTSGNSNSNSNSKITEPFTMLIMGIDSTEEDISSATSFNGDSLILVTFNPKTLNTTMMSIPRDTFVPITCFANDKKNKITHAAWYGESCMMDTIENFTGINIDYYAKINFKGVVKLVDALGGVDIDVPYSFCEQDSNREWGAKTQYVTKGLHTLDGEEVLAFARNRHPNPEYCSAKWTNYYSDDFVRGQNQQTVIKALVSKLKSVKSINKVYEVLDLIEKSMDTNLSTSQILSFYDIGKNILANSANGDILNFQKLYLSTYGAYIYDESMGLNLSDQIYYEGSLKDVVEAMEINLGIKEPTIIKTFSFSVNETYEEEVIGKGDYNEAPIALVPNLTKYTKATATSWGIKNGVNITFKTTESSESKYIDGQIISQSVPTSSLLSIAKSKGIILTIISKTAFTPPSNMTDEIDCTDEDNKDNKACIIPDFVSGNYKASDVTAWKNKLTSDSVTIITLSTTIPTDEESKDGYVCDQGDTKNKSLYNLSSGKITLTYCHYEKDETTDPLDDVLPSDEEE